MLANDLGRNSWSLNFKRESWEKKNLSYSFEISARSTIKPTLYSSNNACSLARAEQL